MFDLEEKLKDIEKFYCDCAPLAADSLDVAKTEVLLYAKRLQSKWKNDRYMLELILATYRELIALFNWNDALRNGKC
jgi:hypothetical protein